VLAAPVTLAANVAVLVALAFITVASPIIPALKVIPKLASAELFAVAVALAEITLVICASAFDSAVAVALAFTE
jgi:hypothetical protein